MKVLSCCRECIRHRHVKDNHTDETIYLTTLSTTWEIRRGRRRLGVGSCGHWSRPQSASPSAHPRCGGRTGRYHCPGHQHLVPQDPHRLTRTQHHYRLRIRLEDDHHEDEEERREGQTYSGGRYVCRVYV
ncbi:hypothetical protein Pcinc_013533 [Petrolisthes cinctipes]|uniref:Uncharacterized protein n=1 Tax=Petrolisthes cinctipes TaxID=88211 RepID=A0AAE1FZM4_PETCI|nr:hypothetical protein Pcinc_013533 [Petrolisthes cinctipes]